MAYNYTITANYPDAVVTVNTNDIEVAILTLTHYENATSVFVINGFTGEVLAYFGRNVETYFEDAFGLAYFGYLIKSVIGGE